MSRPDITKDFVALFCNNNGFYLADLCHGLEDLSLVGAQIYPHLNLREFAIFATTLRYHRKHQAQEINTRALDGNIGMLFQYVYNQADSLVYNTHNTPGFRGTFILNAWKSPEFTARHKETANAMNPYDPLTLQDRLTHIEPAAHESLVEMIVRPYTRRVFERNYHTTPRLEGQGDTVVMKYQTYYPTPNSKNRYAKQVAKLINRLPRETNDQNLRITTPELPPQRSTKPADVVTTQLALF